MNVTQVRVAWAGLVVLVLYLLFLTPYEVRRQDVYSSVLGKTAVRLESTVIKRTGLVRTPRSGSQAPLSGQREGYRLAVGQVLLEAFAICGVTAAAAFLTGQAWPLGGVKRPSPSGRSI